MTIDEFLKQIQKPQYVYTMAKANLNSSNPGMRKSADTRMMNAEKEIDNAIYEYCCQQKWITA